MSILLRPDWPCFGGVGLSAVLGLLLLCSISISSNSCSSGNDSANSSNTSVNSANSTPCGPIQELPRKSAVWTFYSCNHVDNLYITPETKDSTTGEPLGTRSVARGKLSFRFTNLINKNISSKENFGAFFQAEGEQGKEVNWQWMSYNIGNDQILSRLIIQRFDGSCAPRRFCEQSYITDELQFTSLEDVWQWDCQWNQDDSYIICDISKPSDPSFAPVRAWNQMLGNYYALKYIGLGVNAYQGPYPGYNATVFDVKFTLFE